jgi:membrane carboxypeptidase/penicillin-binding protein PbpC
LTDLLLLQYLHEQHIHSSIESRTQWGIKQLVDNYLQQNRSAGIRNAAVLLLAHSMQVRALIGSANYWDVGIKGQVNGTQAKRLPGFDVKAFIVSTGLVVCRDKTRFDLRQYAVVFLCLCIRMVLFCSHYFALCLFDNEPS